MKICLTTSLIALAMGACAADAGPLIAAPECDAAAATDNPRCPGALAPDWLLTDENSRSATFGQTYGLEAFRGDKVAVVSLYASW